MPPINRESTQVIASSNIDQTETERLVTFHYEHVKSYSQVVLGIGYASIFATWAFTKDQLTPSEVLWSALLVSLSVFSYVVIEVINTIIMSFAIMRAGMQKTTSASLAEMQKAQVRPNFYFAIFAAGWLFSFLTGVASAIILLRAFMMKLL